MLVALLLLFSGSAAAQVIVANDDGIDARANAKAIAARLGSKDAYERQRAAEALATLAAVSEKKMLEGYRLQEKDKSVRLALDWALYRTGKTEALYQIVRELDSSRHDQAVGYLQRLDSPALLHEVLLRDRNQPQITAGILEALAKIGNNESLELAKSFRDSFNPGVAAAAEIATDAMEKRLAQNENMPPSRPRTVGSAERPSP